MKYILCFENALWIHNSHSMYAAKHSCPNRKHSHLLIQFMVRNIYQSFCGKHTQKEDEHLVRKTDLGIVMERIVF